MILRDSARILGATWDLTELSDLSDSPDQVLFVSERTLNILANLAQNEVGFYGKYIGETLNGGLVRVIDDDDSEAEDVDRIAQNFGLEVIPVGNWIAPSGAIAVRTAATQSIPNTTVTKVVFDDVNYDPEGIFDLTNDWAIIPQTAYYQVGIRLIWSPNTVGARVIHAYLNGGLYLLSACMASPAGYTAQELNQTVLLSEGQKIEVYAQQTSGAALTIGNLGLLMNSTLSIFRIG